MGDLNQLAAWLEHDSVDSGTFRMKLATARTFGVVDVKEKRISLTDLGNEMWRVDMEARAKALAFLQVLLYRAIYEKYKGKLLPGNAVLETDMVDLGVASKQKARVRQGFQRSAEIAELGKDRLLLPGGVSSDSKTPNGSASRKMENHLSTSLHRATPARCFLSC